MMKLLARISKVCFGSDRERRLPIQRSGMRLNVWSIWTELDWRWQFVIMTERLISWFYFLICYPEPFCLGEAEIINQIALPDRNVCRYKRRGGSGCMFQIMGKMNMEEGMRGAVAANEDAVYLSHLYLRRGEIQLNHPVKMHHQKTNNLHSLQPHLSVQPGHLPPLYRRRSSALARNADSFWEQACHMATNGPLTLGPSSPGDPGGPDEPCSPWREKEYQLREGGNKRAHKLHLCSWERERGKKKTPNFYRTQRNDAERRLTKKKKWERNCL